MSVINYQAIIAELRRQLGDAVSDDPVRRFAWSTDASYFRIVPQVVIRANDLATVKTTLAIANRFNAPVTFRAAGTSLSGQSLGEGILLMLGYDGFNKISISEDKEKITLGAGIIGADANNALAQFKKKIGPDPGSIRACMIGGIINNNSSGMCCGTAQNSYQTIDSMRIVLVDGSELDTGSETSKAAFRKSHPQLLDELSTLSSMAKTNPALAERIRYKYKIKNTTGYSLNALIDFEDPFEILQHLIIGSEGTLAFVNDVTYHTVEDAPFKATALAVFYDLETGAKAIPMLKEEKVSAAELLDWTTVKLLIGKPGMPVWLKELPEGTSMMLVEVRSDSDAELKTKMRTVANKLAEFTLIRPAEFSDDPAVYGEYWLLRQSLYTIVGANRPKGNGMITEDMAFRTEDLAAAIHDLGELFIKHGYSDGIIFGHALAGNVHFLITPPLNTNADISRYEAFMEDVVKVTIEKYDGSLKAEHGTGRAVAPFVEREWGPEAYHLMKNIKRIFDPKGILNPDVILSDDKDVHLKNMKSMSDVDDLVDHCIECGFCEKTCPTNALNLTPRQRIATLREIQRLENNGEHKNAEIMRLAAQEDVIDTCTACQLCTIACPVDNDVGNLVRKLRTPLITSTQQKVLDFQAKHWGAVNKVISGSFDAIDGFHKLAGDSLTSGLMRTARLVSKEVPAWNKDFPKGGDITSSSEVDNRPAVVYFAACGGRTFGPTPLDIDKRPLAEVVKTLIERAGYRIIVPENTRKLCCGQMWESKGDFKNAKYKGKELIESATELTENGKYPLVIDALSCTASALHNQANFTILDLVDFLSDSVLGKLNIHKKSHVALHLGCSARKLEKENKLENIVKACSETILKPEGITCCGFAGEKGLYKPEINASALRHLKSQIPEDVSEGYYANRMCEVGLSHHSGISYRHVAYLMEECSR